MCARRHLADALLLALGVLVGASAPAAPRSQRLLLSSLHPISRSGYGQQTQLLVSELQTRGWEVHLLTWNVRYRDDHADDLESLLRKHGVDVQEALRQAGGDPRVLLPGVPLVTAKYSPPHGHEDGLGWLEVVRAVNLTRPDVVLHLHDAWWLGPPPAAATTASREGRLPPIVSWLPIVFDPLLSDDPTRPDRSGAAFGLFDAVITMSLWGRGVYEAALASLAEADSAMAVVGGDGEEPRQATARWLPPLLGRVPHALHPAFQEGPLGSAAIAKTREVLGLPEDAFIVLVVGRNPPPPSTEARRKSHQAAIRAFARFKQWALDRCGTELTAASVAPGSMPACRTPHLHLHCEFEGGVDLRSVLQENGLALGAGATNTRETLSPEQLRALYGASDVLLQLSRAEGFGLPVVEAQACGTPVIANGATAMAEHVVLGQVLPLAGKASGGRADRLGSWTPPDVNSAAHALLAAWQAPPSFAERNRARLALAAEFDQARVGAAMDAQLRGVIHDRQLRGKASSQHDAHAGDGVNAFGDTLAFAEAGDPAQPSGVAAQMETESRPFTRVPLQDDLGGCKAVVEDPRPICSGEYRTFATDCLTARSGTGCITLQDEFRKCLQRDWTRLGSEPKPRLPYPKGTEALHRQVSTRFGAPMLYSVFDLYVGRSLEVYGEWLGRELDVYAALISSDSAARILEIGANIGALTVPLAQLVGLRGQVIAVEADRVNSQLLAANVALAQLLNVDTLRLAVGAALGKVEMPPDKTSSRLVFSNLRAMQPQRAWSRGGDTPPAGVKVVERTTVDRLSTSLERLDLLKVALPGDDAARLALLGARKTLQRLQPWLFLELTQPHGAEAESIRGLLGPLGYSCVLCEFLLFNTANWRRERENVFVPAGAAIHNLFCGHREGPVGVGAGAWTAAKQVCDADTAASASAASAPATTR